jgi:hypothetical protein
MHRVWAPATVGLAVTIDDVDKEALENKGGPQAVMALANHFLNAAVYRCSCKFVALFDKNSD